MKAIQLGIVASALTLGVAHAQTAATPAPATPVAPPATVVTPSPAMPSTTVPAPVVTAPPVTPAAPVARPAAPAPGAPRAGVVNRNTGPAAASGDSNQAVATTTANAPTPAHGRNSFTRGEARRRIETRGFAQVSGLAKDANGVWRGKAMKNGASVSVWLDYKGNIGQQ